MEQALEKLLDNTFSLNITKDRMYQTIDTYARGTTQLYSFDPEKQIEGPGSILRKNYDLGNGYSLQERFDFSGHDGLGPHINYEINTPYQSKPLKSILGDAHQIELDIFKK